MLSLHTFSTHFRNLKEWSLLCACQRRSFDHIVGVVHVRDQPFLLGVTSVRLLDDRMSEATGQSLY